MTNKRQEMADAREKFADARDARKQANRDFEYAQKDYLVAEVVAALEGDLQNSSVMREIAFGSPEVAEALTAYILEKVAYRVRSADNIVYYS